MTQLNSGELPDRNIVCVAIIEDYVKDFLWSSFDGNVKFQCCEISKEETEESAYIQCELDVQVRGWLKAFNGILNLLTVLMMLYCPAFLLFLPDSIFNLQEEGTKEERHENEQQSEGSHHQQSNQQISRYGSTAEANVNAENDDSVSLVTLPLLTQSQQANSQIGEDTSNKHVQSLLYLDEPNPITLSYFLRNYTKELFNQYRYCLTPMFIGVQISLVGFQLLLMAILTDGCLVGGLSCRCITRMFGLVTLGLVLNASIAGPFLALSIAALTNIYLCYYNLQMYYRDVKEMISEKWQTLDGKREHGAIPEDLFWRICSEASNSNKAVPPVSGEVNRMLSNMAII
nr:uncharacterized protein LOC131781626 [Pocillopora verrucosa]